MKEVPEKDPASVSGRGGTLRRDDVTLTPEVSRSQTPPPHRPVDSRPPGDRPAPDPRSLQRLQRAAGNSAVSRLVAQRYTAPVKPPPAQAPGFRRVKADVAAKRTRIAVHAPAATESKSAQDAAVAPPDDKEAQGKAANAEKMNAAKPGEFNKQAFIDAVNKAIDAQAPKSLDQADKFSKSGKADKIKDEVDGKVTDGKESSAKDIDTATKAPPDTSAAKDKPVTPLSPDQPPPNPGAPSATDAIPPKQPASVTDFSQGPAENDKAMADAEVTEDQLAKGNEPEFDQALSAKKTAEADSAKAPAKGRTAEARQLSTAKAGAAASGAQAMTALTATRAAAGKQVDGGKGETKSKDEKRRAEVTAKLQKIYDGTKKDVETTLSDLDKKVDTAFTAGEKAARDAFTADHKRRMKAYKDKRYSGMFGPAKWAKDKLMGMPKEANDLFQEARKLYVAKMQTVISSVADIIGAELGRAKARIAKGRAELKAEVDKLPADLRQFGEDAAKDFAGKFDDLEATVNEKSEQLVQDLANKYTAALNKIDEEIKKLQEANKGLVQKAKDAIVGALKTINELKNLLLGILAKAASAIMKIIKDPIGFLGNLVRAVGAGLNLFITNVAEHLKTGVVSWLLGTAVKAGLELPQKFDLKGIIQLIASLLGLTWANIRARITRKGIPDQAMSAVEQSVPVAQTLAREGPAGAAKEIEAEAGDLKATILEKLTSYLIPTVVIAGITWIISLLNPASAFVRAVKGIIDIVTFIVNQGAQIVEFVNAVLDAVIAIANGGAAGVPKMVEAALAASVPLLIGFLASLLGIGGLANKVKSVFHAVSRPVNRAIDKIVDFIAKKGKALWAKLKPKPKKDGNGKADSPNRPAGQRAEQKKRELPEALREAQSITQDHERRGSSDRVLMKALKELKKRFKWIRGFEIEEQKPRSVWLLASKNKVFDDWPRSLHGSGGGSTDDELVEAARKRFFGSRTSVACYYCHRLDAEAVEHIRPRNRGGDNEESNLAPVCVHCNSSKGDRVAPKTPPRGYEGKWPAPWWPTQMQVWYVMHYGTPPRYWNLDEDEKPDERFHDGTSPRIPPGSHGGSTDESVLKEARKRIFAGRREVACLYCAKPRATAVEHIWPRKYGGDNEESNLGPSCARCNSSKGDRPAPETPPHDYVGKWPPPWWPTRMQVWWVQTYGPPKEYR
ncbi:HNH endonuclease [Streptomyces sp. NPDC056230]|uniref:HNH endonuclease n=1 Tax=Streptomyces sp. NPDC056230 TaxID=3345754 RepID=UPI0035E17C0D